MSKALLTIEILCILSAVALCIAWFIFDKSGLEPIVIILVTVPAILEKTRRTLMKKKTGNLIYGVTAANNSVVSIENSDGVRIIDTEAKDKSTVSVKNTENATLINVKAKNSSNVNLDDSQTKT